MKFEQELTRYTSILAPIARAIKSLEATDATAADVYLFWLGIASSLKALFARSEHETGIPRELAQKITGIVNKRYKGIIDHAPDNIYFNTYFLHPSTCKHRSVTGLLLTADDYLCFQSMCDLMFSPGRLPCRMLYLYHQPPVASSRSRPTQIPPMMTRRWHRYLAPTPVSRRS